MTGEAGQETGRKRPPHTSSKRLACCCVSSRENKLLMVRDFARGGISNQMEYIEMYTPLMIYKT